MILKAAILTGTATALVAGAITGAVLVKGGPRVVVPATAFASAKTTPGQDWWFEPSGALVPKGACSPAGARPGSKPVPAEDRLIVRHNAMHYRDVANDPVPHQVFPPRPAGTGRLGSDSQLARLKDGRLLYVEMGQRTVSFTPKPFWHDYAGYLRTTMELYTSADCGETWNHARTLDTKDLADGQCAVPQYHMVKEWNEDGEEVAKEAPWPGGFDRFEVHVDPWRGDVYVTSACRGGTAPQFIAEDLYRRVLLMRFEPDLSDWHLATGIELNYGPPVAVTTTADGSVHLLRCDYAKRPQLLRLADRGERLVSVTDVRHAGETDADAACSNIWGEATEAATGMDMVVPDIRLAPAGPRAVRLAYHQVVDGRPRLRYYSASYAPLPADQPCGSVRKAYLAQFGLPNAVDLAPVPECGTPPSFSTARTVGGDDVSVVHFDLIAPDVTALQSEQAMASSMLYWMEHNPSTKRREVRYRTISANGTWSDVHTASSEPWKPQLHGELTRDADYEYGGYAFVDGRCRYALVWNQSHPTMVPKKNIYAHFAIVDDLSCTGTVAKPAPTPTPSPTTRSPLPLPKPSVTLPPKPSIPPPTAPPVTAPPTTPPPTTPPPKSTVTGVTLSVETCKRYGAKWRCSYTAKFTYSKGSGGGFYWRVEGTLRHDCYPDQGGAVPYAKPSTYTEIASGQTSFSAGSYMEFEQAPNPAQVNGAAAQLSDAHVQLVSTDLRSADTTFASDAVCGKP